LPTASRAKPGDSQDDGEIHCAEEHNLRWALMENCRICQQVHVVEQYVWPEVLRETMKLAGVNFFMQEN